MARKISFDPPVVDANSGLAPVDARVSPPQFRPLMGLERPIRPIGALGAISQSLGDINDKVRRADEIEQKLVKGQIVVDLDPGQIDASFARDRMDETEAQRLVFRSMISEHGQAVPILVRPNPRQPGRYEVAFGHRRLRAARDLGIKVRAVVRDLTDEQLVIAQGQENSGRTDLTFIERARFAAVLEDRKFSRDIIMASLNVDKAALSRLIAVARRVPADIIDAIGPAPAFGRVRWQELTELIEREGARARAIVAEESFVSMDSDKRFETLHGKLRARATRARMEPWNANDGARVARISHAGKRFTVSFDDSVAPSFGAFVTKRLQALYDEYKAGNP